MELKNTSNPTLSMDIINKNAYAATGKAMTVQGAVNKTFVLLLLVLMGAIYTWSKAMTSFETGAATNISVWSIVGSVAALVLALVISFKHHLAPKLAPIYAVCEGLLIGTISALFEAMMPGIVIRAVLLTFCVLFTMLFLYKMRVIQVTQRFRTIVMVATISIALAYLLSFILQLFGVGSFINGTGNFSILISIVIVGIAALNLVLDFDFIESGAQRNLPAHYEWYGAFGLMVTLIWLYIEVLRLLSKVSSRE